MLNGKHRFFAILRNKTVWPKNANMAIFRSAFPSDFLIVEQNKLWRAGVIFVNQIYEW